MFKFLVIASLVSVTLAGGAGSNKCPWVFGKHPYDETKMVGEWKIVAANTHLGHRCGKFVYETKDGTHNVKYSGFKDDGKSLKGEIIGQPLMSGKPGGMGTSLAVWKKEDGTYTSTFKETIVATDYDTYALLLTCGHKFNATNMTFEKKMKAAILSRKDTLGEETIGVLKNILSSYDIAIDNINAVDRKNC